MFDKFLIHRAFTLPLCTPKKKKKKNPSKVSRRIKNGGTQTQRAVKFKGFQKKQKKKKTSVGLNLFLNTGGLVVCVHLQIGWRIKK